MKLLGLLNLLHAVARDGRMRKVSTLRISPWDLDELEEEMMLMAAKCVGPEYKIVKCHVKKIAGIEIVADLNITIGEAMPE